MSQLASSWQKFRFRIGIYRQNEITALINNSYELGRQEGLKEGAKFQAKVLADFAQERLDKLLSKEGENGTGNIS